MLHEQNPHGSRAVYSTTRHTREYVWFACHHTLYVPMVSLISCLFVCASAASIDHPTGEARVGNRKNKTTPTGGGQEDTTGPVRRIIVRGTRRQ